MDLDTVNGGAGSDTCQQGELQFADTVTECSP